MTSNVPLVWDLADAKGPAFRDLSDRVWDTPELNFAEVRSDVQPPLPEAPR